MRWWFARKQIDPGIARARTLLDHIGAELQALSYEQLQALDKQLPWNANDPKDEWRFLRDVTWDDQKAQVYALIDEWGLRKRISVELILLSEDGSIGPDNLGCVYFERSKSGKLFYPIH